MGVAMRPKRKAILVLIGAAMYAGLFVVRPAAGETVIHVILPGDGLTYKFMDIGHDGCDSGIGWLPAGRSSMRMNPNVSGPPISNVSFRGA
jgi:hypothetical protein